jgi:ABC-type branched-subunit amino acid transport system ATPase component
VSTSSLATPAERSAPPGALLTARNVTVRFGGLVALSEVGVEVPRGGIVGLVGPNGAGKSTLFDVLSGYRRPQKGRVEFAGRDVSRLSAQARARLGIARTFQQPKLFTELTVREHVVLAHRLSASRAADWGDTATEDEWADGLLASLDLASDAHRMAEGLPLGVARRVELARALAGRPTLMLLDEPSSGLDETETTQFVSVLLDAARRHDVALLLVEHDVDLVMGISSQIHVLDFGRLIASGDPATVRADPAVKAAYLGDDPAGTGGGSDV